MGKWVSEWERAGGDCDCDANCGVDVAMLLLFCFVLFWGCRCFLPALFYASVTQNMYKGRQQNKRNEKKTKTKRKRKTITFKSEYVCFSVLFSCYGPNTARIWSACFVSPRLHFDSPQLTSPRIASATRRVRDFCYLFCF